MAQSPGKDESARQWHGAAHVPAIIRSHALIKEHAVAVAVSRVATLPQITPDSLARMWHGPATATSTSVAGLNYARCLAVALTLESAPRLARTDSRFCGHEECRRAHHAVSKVPSDQPIITVQSA
jgi:hypothetical protein